MTKILMLACALLLCSVVSASASQPHVPRETLRAMGIGAMQTLSDEAGLAVRGKGTFASVSGTSRASWGGQSSTNSYSAGASWLGKGSNAAGSSLSYAGKFQGSFGGFGRFGR
jgi:hypothetical protein